MATVVLAGMASLSEAHVNIGSETIRKLREDLASPRDNVNEDTLPHTELSFSQVRVKLFPILRTPGYDHFPAASQTDRVSFRNPSGLEVRDLLTGEVVVPSVTTQVRLVQNSDGISIDVYYLVTSGAQFRETKLTWPGSLWVTPAYGMTTPTAFQYPARPPTATGTGGPDTILQFAGGFAVKLFTEGNRGNQATPGPVLNVINFVDLETYVSSVVGSEMLRTFCQNAKGFQAIAARTNAIVAMVQSRSVSNSEWDILPTTMNQQFLGISKETQQTRHAAEMTASEYLAVGGYNPIYAMYHSNSGGMTCASNECQTRGTPFDYLQAVPDAANVSERRFGGHSVVKLTSVQVFGVTQNLPSVRAVVTEPYEVVAILESSSNKSSSNRTWVYDLVVRTSPMGATQTVALSAADSRLLGDRLRFGFRLLKSPNDWNQPLRIDFVNGAAEVKVYGFGHAVGASQWGAHLLGLPRSEGGQYEWSPEKISTHFYPGSTIVKFRR